MRSRLGARGLDGGLRTRRGAAGCRRATERGGAGTLVAVLPGWRAPAGGSWMRQRIGSGSTPQQLAVAAHDPVGLLAVRQGALMAPASKLSTVEGLVARRRAMVSRDTFIVSRMLRKIWPSCSSRHDDASLPFAPAYTRGGNRPPLPTSSPPPGSCLIRMTNATASSFTEACFSKPSPLSKLGVLRADRAIRSRRRAPRRSA